jgi:secreted PhoX family phosphatase
MVKKLRRRTLLQTGGAAAVSALAIGERSSARAEASTGNRSEGPLVRDPKGVLDLPAGFSYRILQRSGEALTDGYRVPNRPDAMGCFAGPPGTASLILMRNHEVTPGDIAGSPYHPGQAPPPEAYDPEGTGGVTRVVLDRDTLEIRRSNLVLAGTYWNCAGGTSPWGWLSCEEFPDHPRHGYVFLCATYAEAVREPRRVVGYGRMRHEAATIDPVTNLAYLTEDRPDGCFYRFVPKDWYHPLEGTLQAMCIAGQPRFDTANMAPGQRLPVDWIDVEDPDSADDSIRMRSQAKGAARVFRGEGLWLGDKEAFFCATQGGRLGKGQVFRLRFGGEPTLEVIAEADESDMLDMPDNLCVSPHGQLFVAEDGSGGNFIRRITLDGHVTSFARNAVSSSEFAGPCFSPDGGTLFVNIQGDGLTLAISGPFAQLSPQGAPSSQAAHASGGGPDLKRGLRGVGSGLAVLALAALVRRKRARARKPPAV